MTDSLTELINKRFPTGTNIVGNRAARGTHALQLKHRSFRNFEARPVNTETLELLLACALSAPSKSDLQQGTIIHVADKDARDFIQNAIPSMPWIKSAPEFFLFCGDSRRIRKICECHNINFSHDPIDSLINATTDAAMLLQNFIIAAEAEGLGSCPISAVREVTDKIAHFFNLPEGVFPIAGLCLGYTNEEPEIKVRLPMTITVHKNKYNDTRFTEELVEYDKVRNIKNPIKEQRHTEIFGHDQNYSWSLDKARQTSQVERTAFSSFIRKNGFDL